MVLSVPRAELVGTLVETLCYGAYLPIFWECVQVLYSRHLNGRPVVYLSCTAILIFILVTTHFVVDVDRIVEAFTSDMSSPNAALHYFSDINSRKDLVKSYTYLACTWVSDVLMVYRCYIVWRRSWLVIIVPVLLFLGDIAMAIWAGWSLTQVRLDDNVLFSNATIRAKYFYTMTLVLNILCTGLISYRIWRTRKNVTSQVVGSQSLSRLIETMIESAALYSAYLIALIATSATGTAGLFIVLNSITSVIGIVFSYVITRASTNNSFSDVPPLSRDRSSLNFASVGSISTQRRTTIGSHAPMAGFPVDLEHVVPKDTDCDDDGSHGKIGDYMMSA